MKRFLSVFFTIVLIFVMSSCGNSNNSSSSKPISIVKHNVKIHIDFTKNLLFSTYDISLAIGAEKRELSHGEDADFEFELEEGEQTITFKSASDSSIKTEKTLNVDCNMQVEYKISCHMDKITVEEIYVDRDRILTDTEIKITVDKSAFQYKNYKDVVNKLKEIGFTNIVEEPVYDIEWGLTKEGEVDAVTIGGSDSYKRGDIFEDNIEVVVRYHLKSTSDPNRIFPPYDSDTADGKDYKEIVKAFEDEGWTNIITEKKEETDIWGHKDGEVGYIYVNGESVNQFKDYSLDDEVRIVYYVIVEGGPSKTELSSYYAQKAFEKHGESQYPYGFKCHWFKDCIAEEKRSDGSWFLKVGVTVTNIYGAEYKTVAEGIVSGTDANAKVIQFYVSK